MPLILVGEDPTVEDTRQQLSSLSRRFPRPTNQVALAAALSVWQPVNARAIPDVHSGTAESFAMPLGVLPRMALLAAGWTKPGDKLREPNDTKWWQSTYKFALWNPLLTWADVLANRENGEPPFDWHAQVASGDTVAISDALQRVADDLRDIQAVKADRCMPYKIPTKRGEMPTPNVVCLAQLAPETRREEIERGVDKLLPSLDLPWWLWVGLGLVVAHYFDKD
jgi:hypothetical protein